MKTKLKRIYTYLLLLGTLGISACDTYGNTSAALTSETVADGLTGMMSQWTLPPELREVSGIALLDDNLMACVQDEEGAVYLYDLKQKRVVEKVPFAGPGDYEGIALNGSTAYILRSDGAVFELQNFRNGKPVVTEHKSLLAGTQNTEGLAYDKANNRLLIACKGYDQKLGDVKGIYAFTLDDKKMQRTPVITIPLSQDQLRNTSRKQKDRYKALQPSSLEFHPLTDELYLLDAVNKRLLVIDPQGQIRRVANLDKKLFRQAEGLSFGENGEMYISSEGSKKGSGIIVQYPKGI